MTALSPSPTSVPPSPRPPPPATLLDYTLRTAPFTVIKGTASFTVLGALAGSATGVARNIPAIPAAFTTSLNTGVFSFTFFSIREYVLHPLFISLNLRPSPLEPSSSEPSAVQQHTHNLPSSILSGTISGTIFHAFMRGGRIAASSRAGLTLGIGCGVVQSVGNELGVMRRGVLRWREDKDREREREQEPRRGGGGGADQDDKRAGTTGSLLDGTAPLSHKDFSIPSRETFSERSDRLIGEGWGWVKSRVAALSPVKKIDKGEYVGRLEKRLSEVESERAGVMDELKHLEDEMERRRRGTA